MKDVIKFLKEQGAQVSEGYRERIEEWRGWYRGQVKHFHEYAVFNGQKRVNSPPADAGYAEEGGRGLG